MSAFITKRLPFGAACACWALLALVLLTGAAVATEETGNGVDAESALDQHGETHAWQGPAERYRVLDFAAEWCAPCWHSLPKFQELADQHPEIDFLVISVDEAVRGRDRLVKDLDLKVPVLWDSGHQIAERYQPKLMPTTIVLDPLGDVIYEHGGSAEEDWQALVRFVEAIGSDSKQ